MTAAPRVAYRPTFDRAAASFGTEPFSSIQLRERVQRLDPRLVVRSDMVFYWSAPHLLAERLEIVGVGPKKSHLFRVVGEWNVHPEPDAAGVPVPDAGGTSSGRPGSLPWSAIDRLLQGPFRQRSFDADALRKALATAHPEVSSKKLRSSVSTCLAYRLKAGALVVTTPGKARCRWYRMADAAPAHVEPPVVTPPESAPPPDPTAALAVALGAWLAETVKLATDALAATFKDREAALQAALREARLARLDELAATLPDHPRLFAAVQEIRRKEAPAADAALPAKIGTRQLTYSPAFAAAFGHAAGPDQVGVLKALKLLVHNGSHYPSLATKRVDRPLPGTPLGAWVSRAGDWRFTWESANGAVRCFQLFRRGDAPAEYGSEA